MDFNSRVQKMMAMILLVLLTGSVAFGDRVRINLEDGSRWRGEIGQEISVVYSSGQGKKVAVGKLAKATDLFLQISDVQGAEDGAPITILVARVISISEPGQSTPSPAVDGQNDTENEPVLTDAASEPASGEKSNSKGVFVLPLSGTVGVEFRSDEIRKMAEEADKRGHGQIIVMHIDSGGGSLFEYDIIAEQMEDIKKRHRVVAWIKSAISASAATAMCCHEIYFQTGGTLGAATGFNGATGVSITGQPLQDWINRLAEVTANGNRSAYIGPAMIDHRYSLSYSRDPETGDVTWYNDLSGDVSLSTPGKNLVFNVTTAIDSGFADGRADTVDELAENLEIDQWVEISDYGRELHDNWLETIEKCTRDLKTLQRDTQIKSFPNEAARIGWLIERNKKYIRWLDRCPPVARNIGRTKEDLERENKYLQKQLRDMR